MAEKISVVLLRKVIELNKQYIDILIAEAAPVVCLNKDLGRRRILTFKALYDNNNKFWINTGGGWEYYLEKVLFEEMRTLLEKKKLSERILRSAEVIDAFDDAEEPEEIEEEPDTEDLNVDSGFGREYARIVSMSSQQRVDLILEDKKRLDDLIAKKVKDPEAIKEALVATTTDAALINRATLIEAMQQMDDDAKARTQSLVESTQDMVKSSVQLISEDIFNDEMMKTLVEKSNGTVIQHMTRVFLNGLSFLRYYNNLVSTSSIINKYRISFNKKYKKFYRPLFPHLYKDDITLERIFYKGMRAISEDEFYKWATGFLVHDIGKATSVEYHEGEAEYNRDIVVDHVKIGYTAVMTKTNYPRDAGLITGYHHEYYGDPSGYGYFRSYLDEYKKVNPSAMQDYCIAYELEPMLDYLSLGYFPAKILEIIDVYDSLTDKNRKYRKVMTPEEALSMMREEFIEKHLKIDIILFELFADFVQKKL